MQNQSTAEFTLAAPFVAECPTDVPKALRTLLLRGRGCDIIHAKGNDGAEKAKSTEDKSETNGKHKIGMGRLKREVGECKVCARPSLYCYYGVKCCESCKQFFRRIVSKRTFFNCFEGKDCEIGEDGIRCRGCRLDKCLLAGMEPTLIKAKPKDREALAQYLARLELRKRSALARNN
ncbi:hypothetical protein niasHT_009043 [Heterodera trifolii]|uniref:Nuclear receptor domain-containing protein n=1 Tax=Heterodera trifolii TaxID=157864 RepID=A0ABD2M286_9BILA